MMNLRRKFFLTGSWEEKILFPVSQACTIFHIMSIFLSDIVLKYTLLTVPFCIGPMLKEGNVAASTSMRFQPGQDGSTWESLERQLSETFHRTTVSAVDTSVDSWGNTALIYNNLQTKWCHTNEI